MKGEKIRESAKCKSYFNLTNFFKSTFQFSPIHPVILKIPFWHILKILYRILSKSIYTKAERSELKKKGSFFPFKFSNSLSEEMVRARRAHEPREEK